ncbi:polar amino acid transport system permease protein [Paenibacillus methanolicus]|uniref:Polar amino acid transport system permease protein n=2 Tax=Paenibacillus methanolicus TaxID=582686 RepID=A0A5S5CHS7_9BACL|nr:amino acid ABC transporter permease [Paenibacillus methanolicus]TYP79084.1 polar amino acid transport system permease protein [Paenibacillus methanolicus]
MSDTLQIMSDALPILFEGLLITLKIAAISLVIAFVIGLAAGLMSTARSRIIRGLAGIYVDIIRGTPLLVQVFFIYFGLPEFFDTRIDPEVAGIVAVSLNAGAYIAEVVRAGINSVDKGQVEAARSLGMNRFYTMRLIVLPQALRRMIPALVNQFIISIKDTALLSVIGIRELTQSGEIIISTNFRSFEIWGMVGVFYFLLILPLSRLSLLLERRLNLR